MLNLYYYSGIIRSRVKTVDIVLPCYNECESLPKFFSEYILLRNRMRKKYSIKLIIVDNGSTDETYKVAKLFALKNRNIRCISLSRNFGKEASLTAGLDASNSDACIPMDCDLQDPMEAVDLLLEAWTDDVDVVLARREFYKNRFTWRRIFSKIYSFVFNSLSDTPMTNSVGEFRLMDRKVVEAFAKMPESERFVRGLFSWMGFKSVEISYPRANREVGRSKYNFNKLLGLGIHGLTSFSIKPLRIATFFGILGSVGTFAYAAILLYLAFSNEISIPGYASTLVSILLLGSIQLLTIGILGEYVGKTLLEAKRRPVYIIREIFEKNGK